MWYMLKHKQHIPYLHLITKLSSTTSVSHNLLIYINHSEHCTHLKYIIKKCYAMYSLLTQLHTYEIYSQQKIIYLRHISVKNRNEHWLMVDTSSRHHTRLGCQCPSWCHHKIVGISKMSTEFVKVFTRAILWDLNSSYSKIKRILIYLLIDTPASTHLSLVTLKDSVNCHSQLDVKSQANTAWAKYSCISCVLSLF